jgi:DNA repair protein RecO (recombination protein O)
MARERSEAIVLRAVDFSETSRIVTFLTPERGRLACMAAGARRGKSPLGGLIDTFNRLEIVYYWKDGRSVQKLGEAALLNGFAAIKSDLAKSVYAAFPLEFVYKVAQENQPSQALYAALVAGLEDMAAWTGSAEAHTAWQILHLLRAGGFAPSVTGAPGESARFSYASGVVGFGERSDLTLAPGDHAALRAMSQSRAHCPATPALEGLFQALRRYVQRQLESDFHSLRLIDRVFGHPHRK